MRFRIPYWFRLAGLLVVLTCARAVPPPEPVVERRHPELATRSSSESAGSQAEAPERKIPAPPSSVEAPVPQPPEKPDLLPIPAVVRVGLATDLESVSLPCCDDDLIAIFNRREIAVVSNIEVRPGMEVSRPGAWRLQIAALRAEDQAAGLARRITETMGLAADVVFDAGSGLYKVLAGRFATRELADAGKGRLAQSISHDAWVVSEQVVPENPTLMLRQGDREWMIEGRWMAFEPLQEAGISVLGKRYRGRILVFLNGRGTLNVINEVTFDDYLRGVVPREMGPEVFDNLEALKAQAVAARTYTLRNMGEFSGEGYDICATPRCQVYGGMDAEHPLSDRAVLETSQEVLVYRERYVDALYSSTCGGHTEDVSTVFPRKSAPYLRGVPCFEAGVDKISGDLDRLTPIETGISRRILPLGELSGSAADLARRLKALARLAGLPTRTDSLTSLERREVQRYIASQFDMAVDARLLVNREDIPYLLESPPAGWDPDDLQLAAFLVQAGLFSGALDQPLGEREIEETLFHLSLFLRVVEERSVRYLGTGSGRLQVKEDGEVVDYELPAKLATFSKRSGEFMATSLALVPGDRLRLFVSRGDLIGIAHAVNLDGLAYDRTSNMSSWTRFRSDEDLERLVGERYPRFDLAGFEILDRGVSGRVSRLLLESRDAQQVEIRGLPIRWTLDLPDTLFTAKRLTPPNGVSGWLFTGRGWGHGVGLCQVGSYGMGVRGHGYEEILLHYYSGVELRRAPSDVGSGAPAVQTPSGRLSH